MQNFFLIPALYGSFAMVFYIVSKIRDRAHYPGLKDVTPGYMEEVAKGKNGIQVSNFILSLVLLAMPLIIAASLYSNATIVIYLGFSYILLAPFTIAMNIPHIYNSSFRRAEGYAFYSGKASASLRLQKVALWLVWLFYTGVAYFVLFLNVANPTPQF